MNKKSKDTHERIVEAAYQVLTKQGFKAASIKQIAHEAGVAPGLVHYYFASKDELLVAVLRMGSERYTQEMAHLSEEVPPDRLEAVALAEPKERAKRQPDWYRQRYELFAIALRNPALVEGVRDLLANGRSGIAQVIKKAAGDRVSDVPSLASVLLACFDGLALQKLVDSTFDIEAAYKTLDGMIQPLFKDK